ncbi:hypothetical protein FSP39_016813 [Pinctada imbricata]|uniref:Heat shock 70 kDa protein 12A n=1 Tax=Pinctada imbricata TaxID=66713 RepID=A0AA89C5J6_PINIB|nr:hypothetical protein FSP39_016813 [Pinctada imbricata]
MNYNRNWSIEIPLHCDAKAQEVSVLIAIGMEFTKAQVQTVQTTSNPTYDGRMPVHNVGQSATTTQEGMGPSAVQTSLPPRASNIPQTTVSPQKPVRKLVAAIDFGTTYSGYAFSFRHQYEKDPLKISTNLWAHNNGLSMKAPTAVLIGEDLRVIAFGYDAMKQYSDLAEYNSHTSYYFFQRFKMDLYGNRDLSMESLLTDVNGKRMKAVDVFSKTIGYLKNHMIQRIKESDSQLHMDSDDIHWVLTVPAIWSDKAKYFMRKAAEKAGIEGRHLTLALEPEAASLLCKYTPTYQDSSSENKEQEFKAFEKGSKYMVVDIGGGTVDITVHCVTETGALGLQEIREASGGYWGGCTVDMEFSLLLTKLFGDNVMQSVRTRFPNDVLDMFQDFESKKRSFEPGQTTSISIKLPASLSETYSEMSGRTVAVGIAESEFHGEVRVKRDKILISPSKFRQLFDRSVSNIIQHVNQLFLDSRVTGITTILLVGGYSECHVIKDAFIAAFPHVRLIHPSDSSLTVLKGAVIFGHEPHAISSRVCKYTYGIGMLGPYDPSKHPADKMQEINGMQLCDDLFDTHLHIGKQVSVNEKKNGKQYRPPLNQDYAVLDVYASSAFDPTFVTDDTCTRLGSVVIELSKDIPSNDTITVTLMYRGTELEVEAMETTSRKTTKASFDFLG